MSESTVVPTSVYRYYDINGLLLYVGITSRGMHRQQEHNATKEWWRFVSSQEVEHYPSRAHALSREAGLIRRYRPPFNVQHNPGHEQVRTAYLELAVKDERLVRDLRPIIHRGTGVGRSRLDLDVQRIGETLILTSKPDDFHRVVAVDHRDRSSLTVSFPGTHGTKAKLCAATITDRGLRMVVVCRRNAAQCSGATLMLRMPNGTARQPTLKRIDLRGPGQVML